MRLMRQTGIIAIMLFAALSTTAFSPEQTASLPVWPISGSTTPDLPLSSTFGPRLKASENYRYDFHRGIDIPTPYHSPVYAIADGTVRLAGNYDYYEDTLVQLRHLSAGHTSCAGGGCFYSNYMHLSAVTVAEGQPVTRGQLIGYSGVSGSGFEHLHFEIRRGGIYQKDAVHPLLLLPYQETAAPQITIDHVEIDVPKQPTVAVTVSLPPVELDLNLVEVLVYANTAQGPVLIDQASFDMIAWNQSYTPTDDPNLYLDNPDFNGVQVRPAKFNAASDRYEMTLLFVELDGAVPASQLVVKARATDIHGNSAEAFYPTQTASVFLPLISNL